MQPKQYKMLKMKLKGI